MVLTALDQARADVVTVLLGALGALLLAVDALQRRKTHILSNLLRRLLPGILGMMPGIFALTLFIFQGLASQSTLRIFLVGMIALGGALGYMLGLYHLDATLHTRQHHHLIAAPQPQEAPPERDHWAIRRAVESSIITLVITGVVGILITLTYPELLVLMGVTVPIGAISGVAWPYLVLRDSNQVSARRANQQSAVQIKGDDDSDQPPFDSLIRLLFSWQGVDVVGALAFVGVVDRGLDLLNRHLLGEPPISLQTGLLAVGVSAGLFIVAVVPLGICLWVVRGLLIAYKVQVRKNQDGPTIIGFISGLLFGFSVGLFPIFALPNGQMLLSNVVFLIVLFVIVVLFTIVGMVVEAANRQRGSNSIVSPFNGLSVLSWIVILVPGYFLLTAAGDALFPESTPTASDATVPLILTALLLAFPVGIVEGSVIASFYYWVYGTPRRHRSPNPTKRRRQQQILSPYPPTSPSATTAIDPEERGVTRMAGAGIFCLSISVLAQLIQPGLLLMCASQVPGVCHLLNP